MSIFDWLYRGLELMEEYERWSADVLTRLNEVEEGDDGWLECGAISSEIDQFWGAVCEWCEDVPPMIQKAFASLAAARELEAR